MKEIRRQESNPSRRRRLFAWITAFVAIAIGIAAVFIVALNRTNPPPTPAPTTPSGLTESERDALREYALKLINDARIAKSLNSLTFDDNTAAQSHAEDMRAACIRGHWGRDGMKPYMRYTLAGGQQYSAENVFAIDFCPDDPDTYVAESTIAQIDFAMDLFLNSPGHRQNILNLHHRNVGIGISYRRPTIWFVQLFVGDYIEYETKPTIDSGMLTLSGQVKNGADISGRLSMIIYYDRLPEPLTRGQLSRTYCYTNGLPIAGLRPPLEAGSSYTEDESTMEINSKQCPDPYDIDPDAPDPMSSQEARSNWQQVRDLSQVKLSSHLTFPWITADEWTTHGNNFTLTADISRLIDTYGDGVYTIMLWAEINSERAPISEYSIFIPPLP